jgi:hypothetical protein
MTKATFKWEVKLVCGRKEDCELRKNGIGLSVHLPLILRSTTIDKTVIELLMKLELSPSVPTARWFEKNLVRVEFWRLARIIVIWLKHCPEEGEWTCVPYKIPFSIKALKFSKHLVFFVPAALLAAWAAHYYSLVPKIRMMINGIGDGAKIVQRAEKEGIIGALIPQQDGLAFVGKEGLKAFVKFGWVGKVQAAMYVASYINMINDPTLYWAIFLTSLMKYFGTVMVVLKQYNEKHPAKLIGFKDLGNGISFKSTLKSAKLVPDFVRNWVRDFSPINMILGPYYGVV